MNCFSVEILDSNIKTLEIETCIGDEPKNIEIINYDNNSLIIESCATILPSEINSILNDQIIDSIQAGSGISIQPNSTGALISVSGLDSSYISDFNDHINDIVISGLLNQNVVYTTGNQTITGHKIFNSGISIQASGYGSSATNFPVFISSPATTAQIVYTRTPSQVKNDIGLGNVTDNAQIRKRPSSANGYVPTWNGTSGDYLNIGYFVETVLTGSTTALARADAIKTYIDSLLAANDAMIFKGTIGIGGTVNSLPTTYGAGWTYKVVTAGTYAGNTCEIGDLIIAIIDRDGINNLDSDWTVAQQNIDGSVVNRTLTAGSGLIGGGNLSADRIFHVGAGNGIFVDSDTVSVDSTVVRTTGGQSIDGYKTFLSSPTIQANFPTLIFKTSLLNGDFANIIFDGRNYDGATQSSYISSNSTSLTIAHGSELDIISPATKLVSPNTALTGIYFPVFINDPNSSSQIIYTKNVSGIKNDLALSNVQNIALSGIVFTAGSGLIGGGTLSSDRTFSVGQGDGISVDADSISVNSTVVRITGNQSIDGIKNFLNLITVNNVPVSISGHTHLSSDITNFNSSVSGLLPVKNIIAGSNTLIQNNNGEFTVSVTGLQPSGSYVTTSGDQVITGTKTFLNNVIISGDISAPTGIFNDVIVNNNFELNGTMNIAAAASILASGSLTFEVNKYIVNGSGVFTSGLFVGPTGNPTPVALSGHSHVYTDVTNFCDGVDNCVTTQIIAESGTQLVYNSGTDVLSIRLSGQALALHDFNSNGIIVRTGPATFVARSLQPGTNIGISNQDGTADNPTISLSDNINIGSITTTGDLIVGNNLTVNGTTITSNVETVLVEDPVIVLGQTSGSVSNTSYDRGLELRIGVAQTGFIGYDVSASEYVLLNNTTNINETFNAGTYGALKLGSIEATGLINGRTLESSASSPTAPIVVASTGTVSNLSSDYLDGQHGSYYLDWTNFSNIPDPTITVSVSGDVAGTGSYSWTNLSGNVSVGIQTTIQPNSVALGDDTTGNYVGSVSVNGTGLSVSDTGSEGGIFTISSNATPVCGTGTIVSRDNNGNFCGNVITINSAISGVNSVIYNGNTVSVYSSTSISGIATNNYLFNFIVDGGTP